MKCNFLSWNVRGLGNLKRRRLVKELVGQYKPDVVILKETKLARMNNRIVRSLCSVENVDWIDLPAIGSVGGIIMFWNKDCVQCVTKWVDGFSVSMEAGILGGNQRWVITGVYGPPSGAGWADFLVELRSIIGRRDLPWCIGGDFNEIMYVGERSRAS